MGYPSYSYGYERTNGRGQVFVFLPDHPLARADGFYPRSRFIMEEQLNAQKVLPWNGKTSPAGKGPLAFVEEDLLPADKTTRLGPRLIANTERIYHLDNDPNNDDPFNLLLFPNHKEMMQFRSREYHSTKDLKYKDRLQGLTEVQKQLRDEVGIERAHQMENRRRKAKAAHAVRKKRLAAEARAAKQAAKLAKKEENAHDQSSES